MSDELLLPVVKESYNIVNQYGLISFFAVSIVTFMGWLIRYVLRTNNERDKLVMEENAKREERLAEIINKDMVAMSSSIGLLREEIIKYDARATEVVRRLDQAMEVNRDQNSTFLNAFNEIVKNLRDMRGEIIQLSKQRG